MVHPVVVEPEEALLLPVITTGRPVQVEVVHRHPRPVALPLRAVLHRVVRVAVTLGRGVTVVQVGQERQVRRAEVLPVQAERVLVEVVLESHQGRLAVLGVDHRAREGAVEAVDRAGRQRPLLARRMGDHAAHAGPLERRRRLTRGVDRQHLRGGERMRSGVQVDLVHDRVRRPDPARPELVLLVAQRVLLAAPRTRWVRPRRIDALGHRCQRPRDRQRVAERRDDQRTRREQLEIEHVRQHVGRRGERAIGRQQPPAPEGGSDHSLNSPERETRRTDRTDPQDRTSRNPA